MSEHGHDCDCGCGGHNHEVDELEDLFVTLTTEDGKDIECEVVAIFPLDDEQYTAVTPVGEDSDDIYFFRLEPESEQSDEAILVDIEDEDELEDVAEEFGRLVDELSEE